MDVSLPGGQDFPHWEGSLGGEGDPLIALYVKIICSDLVPKQRNLPCTVG